jgi:hypothetical protein
VSGKEGEKWITEKQKAPAILAEAFLDVKQKPLERGGFV